MNRTSLPLSSVIVNERFRKDLGDLTSLKASIRDFGLIQPVLVNQANVLLAGGRRYHAHVELGLATIDVVYMETLSQTQMQEVELIENIVRKSFTWQEEAMAILKIDQSRRMTAALEGETWNSRLACELFGVSKGALSYVLEVAKRLASELSLPEDKRKFHSFTSCNEAYRLGILAEVEERALALLAKRHKALADATPVVKPAEKLELDALVQEVKSVEAKPDVLDSVRQRYYSNPHNKPDSFEAYWKSRQEKVVEIQNTIHLTPRLIHSSCIDYMVDHPSTFDHIITDIPYGIDVSMMDQSTSTLTDLARIEQAHDVCENMELMKAFFPAAFRCTKEKSFVITYCDIMQWQFMYDLAIAAGFNVQRWPIIWHKQSGAANQAAQYNSTKNYDIIMVCRKPASVLLRPISSSIILASHESAKLDCKHPFSKPYDITRILADAVSNKGDSFFEPFAGGGSIAVELTRQERNVIACEKDDHHYAQLLETYKTFYLKLNPNTVFK